MAWSPSDPPSTTAGQLESSRPAREDRFPRAELRYNPNMSILEPLFRSLNDAEVRYVVVGGLAVVLHGYARMTVDVDLAVDLAEEQARKAIEALTKMSLRPRVPVDPSHFANPEIRQSWIRDRGMQVFSMFDPSNPLRVVDLFVEHPIPFDELWSRS